MLCKNNKRFNSAVAWLDKKLLYNCLLRYTVTAYLKLAVVGVVKLKALSSLKGSPFTALGQVIMFTLLIFYPFCILSFLQSKIN